MKQSFTEKLPLNQGSKPTNVDQYQRIFTLSENKNPELLAAGLMAGALCSMKQ